MPRLTLILGSLLLAIPLLASALEFQDRSLIYVDAPFSMEETAGISILTEIGAVSGNPDGSFAPTRTLNRAEFLKIALLSHRGISVSPSDAETCFPDVSRNTWFSRYVCLGKIRGIVSGYPDGDFRPQNSVNFAEALKILTELELSINGSSLPPSDPWYERYIAWARKEGLLLVDAHPEHPLTRGEVARLAAAYRARNEGELSLYEAFERNEVIHAQQQDSASSVPPLKRRSSSSIHSSVPSPESLSTSSVALNTPDFPARSRFLILGTRMEPIASAEFFSAREPMKIRGVKVVLKNEAESIDVLYLVDTKGHEIGKLSLDSYDSTDKTWKATFGSENAYELTKDTQNILGIEARIKGRNAGGVSEEMIEVDDFTLTVEGVWSQSTWESIPPDFPFPKHQTAQARIASVANALEEKNALPLGSAQLLAEFAFTGDVVPGASLTLEELMFDLSRPSGVDVRDIRLGGVETDTQSSCSLSSNIVSCTNVASEVGSIRQGAVTRIRIFGDVSLSAAGGNPFLQVTLNQPGGVGTNGAIRWTDGTGHFNWTELSAPLARGTRWE